MYKNFSAEKLQSMLPGRDALIIIPPVSPEAPVLGPHVLQACAQEAGHEVAVFYGTLHFMSCVGADVYWTMGQVGFNYLAEHLFVRAAYGFPGLKEGPDGNLTALQDESTIMGTGWSRKVPQFRFFDVTIPRFDRETLIEFEKLAFEWVEKTARVVASFPVPLVGLSCSYEQINVSVALLRKIKELRPDIVTVIGGSNCRGKMAEGIRSLDKDCTFIDHVFSGDSEKTFVAFLDDLKAGKKRDEAIIYGEDCPDLDALPLPDFSGYFKQLAYFVPDYKERFSKNIIPYETSRGCWWRQEKGCLFCCAKQSDHFRIKSPEKVYKELDRLKELYRPDRIHMTDMVMPLEYFSTLLPKLKAEGPLELDFFYEIRTNPLPFKDLLALKEAGVNRVLMGIESLSDTILKKMNKGATAAQNVRALRYARGVSLPVEWNIIWGFPGESAADYRAMVDMQPVIGHLQPPTGLFHLGLNRFSLYTESPEYQPTKKLEPIDSYYSIFPGYSDFNALARYFKPDYQAETQDNPDIILELIREVEKWHTSWKNGGGMCHIFEAGKAHLLMDSRGLPGTAPLTPLTAGEVEAALTECEYSGSDLQKWALDHKLAVLIDGDFIPVATASHDLMDKYDIKNRQTDEEGVA